MALLTIPKDKQRRWEEGHGGVQHPTDDTLSDLRSLPNPALENKFAVGEKGEFEVKGDKIYIRASEIIIEGELVVNKFIRTPDVVRGTKNIPGFEGSKQAEAKDADK